MMRGKHFKWTVTCYIAQTPLCQKMHHDTEKIYELIVTFTNKVGVVVEAL